MTLEEIKQTKEHYTINLYSQVRAEQKTDQSYIDDTFPVPEIHNPHQIYRAGLGDRIVNAPAEHIVTSNPQVFFYPRKNTDAAHKSALKLSELVNNHWLPILQKQNPNIFKEFIKNQLGRGESFIRVAYNDTWDGKYGLPIHFIIPDPMVIFASPEESYEGIPDKVVVWYSISQYKELIPKYPFLSDHDSRNGDMIEWMEYHSSKSRYIELDKHEVTKDGVQPNIYGFTPFVRKYSGFGRRSEDGELANLIVSDIRRSRDLIREECVSRSNISSVEALFAHRSGMIIAPNQDAEKLKEELQFGEYVLNYVNAEPNQVRLDWLEIKPSPDMFAHHAQIIAELNQRHPFIMAGFPLGSSGRQQDMSQLSAMRRYDSVVENTEAAFATALGMALRMCATIPGMSLDGINEKDLRTEFDIEVRLKAKDPIEEDRKITLGDRLWAGGKGSISLSRFHTEYQGLTEDESKKEIARMLADQITIYNPDVAAVMGMVAAEESGMADWLEKAQTRRQETEKGLREESPKTTQERTRGEVETPMGNEESSGRGARQPPSRYTRENVKVPSLRE